MSDKKPKLHLVGKDGNVFAILGLATLVARQAGWTIKQLKEFQTEAMSGNYDHALQTCMKYFEVC